MGACVDAAGNATATPAVSPAFTTEAAVVSTATATVEFEKYYNGSELYAIDDVTYKNYNNKAYLPAKVLHSADAANGTRSTRSPTWATRNSTPTTC